MAQQGIPAGQKVKMVILIVIILISLSFIVYRLIPKRYTYLATLVDVETGKVFRKKMKAGRIEFPIDSPYSKKKTAYRAHKCSECGAVFAYNPPPPPESPEEMPLLDYFMPKCPVCGSMDFGVPQIPEDQKFIQLEEEVIIVGE